MGVAKWFSEFCDNLQVNNRGIIGSRYKAITKRLNENFWNLDSDTSHSLYVGSYGRNTAICGFSDLDMVFELPNQLYFQYDNHEGNGQSSLLQEVRNSIKATYPSSRIGSDGQVVVISFTDPIDFEVVPVFTNRSNSYTFPDSNDGGAWRVTNPKPEIKEIKIRNNSSNGNLFRLCRMMRAWKEQWAVPIGGLLIDTLVYQFIANCKYSQWSYLYYDLICQDLFRFMSNQDKEQAYWRAPGSGQRVYGKGLFQEKAKRCYNLSQKAIKYESGRPKREWSAKQKWREIFGTSFPD